MSKQSTGDTERTEKRNRRFKTDFARAMWRDLPDDAKEQLRDSRSVSTATEQQEGDQ